MSKRIKIRKPRINRVSIQVSENFFNIFENQRNEAQIKMGNIRITQLRFSDMLAKGKIKPKLPLINKKSFINEKYIKRQKRRRI